MKVVPRYPWLTCKVCGSAAPAAGIADFNKNCDEHRGVYLPASGVEIYYYQCGQCGLFYTNSFDDWSGEQFQQHIYNDGYVAIDPDYVTTRPTQNADLVVDFIGGTPVRSVDYGSGNGALELVLRSRGVNCHSWEPLDKNSAQPAGTFDLVTAFEVMEHTPDPFKTVGEALSMLSERGVFLFSTYTLDHWAIEPIDHWYVSPRNGHVTIYSRRSLRVMLERFGYRVHHFSDGLHMALRSAPEWIPRCELQWPANPHIKLEPYRDEETSSASGE